MESRFRVHYQRNTVAAPSPGRKRIKKTMQQRGYVHLGKKMDYSPKTCATSRCVWCEASFGDQFRTICPVCRNCQYCGLASTASLSDCSNCGNKPDRGMRVKKTVLRPSR